MTVRLLAPESLPEAMFVTIAVPASVPSVLQSSTPWAPSSARK